MIAAVPAVEIVEAAFMVNVPPELIVPVRLKVPELEMARPSRAAVPVNVIPLLAVILPVDVERVILPPVLPPAKVKRPPELNEQVVIPKLTWPVVVAAPFKVAAPVVEKDPVLPPQVKTELPVLVGALTVNVAALIAPVPLSVTVCAFAVAFAV